MSTVFFSRVYTISTFGGKARDGTSAPQWLALFRPNPTKSLLNIHLNSELDAHCHIPVRYVGNSDRLPSNCLTGGYHL